MMTEPVLHCWSNGRLLCGEGIADTNWTIWRSAVDCPECRKHIPGRQVTA